MKEIHHTSAYAIYAYVHVRDIMQSEEFEIANNAEV